MQTVWKKYKKLILTFIVSLVISIILLKYGDIFLRKELIAYIFSIFSTITFSTGLFLAISIYGDHEFEKILQREPTEKELKQQEQWAGKLEIDDQDVVFKYGEDQQIKIAISNIKVIGELTTDANPIATDWYLVIVKKNNEVIYLPVYAVGLHDILMQLSKILNHEIVPKLFASVIFDSNIIYPKSFDGKKLFHLEGLNPNGIWEKIKLKLGFSPITPILRNEIIELKE